MGLIKVISDATLSTFEDQWKEIITVGEFNAQTVVVPGVYKRNRKSRNSKPIPLNGIISNGSKIYIPEGTIAFIFNQSTIENIITKPGGYEYQSGEKSLFNRDGIAKSIFEPIVERVGFRGLAPSSKQIAFVNLREIQGIKFGTASPLIYYDLNYGVDLELQVHGQFSIKVTDPTKFVTNFVPPNVLNLSFADTKIRRQLIAEFIQSLISAINNLSDTYRISKLPSVVNEISEIVTSDPSNAGTWNERYGFMIVKIGIENIKYAPESMEIVNSYSRNKMSLKAYDDVEQKSSDIAAQQKVAQGIETFGLGDSAGMVFGMNVGQNLNSPVKSTKALTINEQIENVALLWKLVNSGALSQEEYEIKKKEIMSL